MIQKKIFPFVCVSGINSVEVVTEVRKKIPPVLKRTVVLGVLTTSKTLHNIKEKNHPDRFVNIKLLPSVVESTVKNKLSYVIHHRSSSEELLLEDLSNIMKLAQVDAIQVDAIPNTSFVTPAILRKFKDKFPSVQLILQVGPQAFEEVKNDPLRLNKELKKYGNTLSAILLDKSDSRGIPLDSKELAPFVASITHNLSHLHIIVAGGLNPSTMKNIVPLLKINSKISIDAESTFFKSGKNSEVFSIDAVQNYLTAFKSLK